MKNLVKYIVIIIIVLAALLAAFIKVTGLSVTVLGRVNSVVSVSPYYIDGEKNDAMYGVYDMGNGNYVVEAHGGRFGALYTEKDNGHTEEVVRCLLEKSGIDYDKVNSVTLLCCYGAAQEGNDKIIIANNADREAWSAAPEEVEDGNIYCFFTYNEYAEEFFNDPSVGSLVSAVALYTYDNAPTEIADIAADFI